MSEKKILKNVIGVDGGNSNIKLYLNKGETISFENMYCDRRKYTDKLNQQYDLSEISSDTKLRDMLDVKVSKKGTDISKAFLFGKHASLYRKDIEERKSYVMKSNDEQLVLNSIVSIVTTILERLDKSELQDEMDMEISMCTGLPYNEYAAKKDRENYANAFKGDYEIEFLNPFFPVKKINLNIPNVAIDIEGMAALRQVIFDKKLISKNQTKEELREKADKIISLVDIGCYTTDIVGGILSLVTTDDGSLKLKFLVNSALCFGIEQGIGTAMDLTISELYRKYPDKLQQGDLSRNDILNAINNPLVENELPGRTGLSIEPEYSKQCELLADKLTSEYIDVYKNSGFQNSIYKIILAGGGVKTPKVVEHFRKIITEKLGEDLVEISDNPIFGNAKGYGSIANASFKTK